VWSLGDGIIKRIEPVDELIPLWREDLLIEQFLVVILYSRVLDAVQRQLLQIAQVQLPRDGCIAIVESNTLIVEKAGVVRTDGPLEALEC